MNSSTIWYLFGLFLLMPIFYSYNFWKDVLLFLKSVKERDGCKDKKKADNEDPNSDDFGVQGENKTYLHIFVTELNNRGRWYSTEIWHVAFAYIGITAIVIGQVINKRPDYLSYVFAANAVLGLFVVWHMTRLRSLFTKKDRQLFLIVDDTQTLKRAKKMEATGKLRHHATGKYGIDYTIVKVSLYYRGVRHLRLVDCACACLTHMGIKAYRAQGQNKSKKVLRLEPISKLRDRMRRIVRQENVQNVIKYSHEKPVIRRLEKLLAA